MAAQILNGTAEVNSTVTVKQTVPGPTVNLGTTTATGSSTFAYAHTFGVNQSTTVIVTATDAAGNVSVNSNAYPVVVDQVAPTTSLNSITPAPNAAGWNRASTAVVVGQVDTLGGTDKLWTSLNGATFTSVTTATRSVTVGTTVQGANTVRHYAVDKAGNTGSTTTTTVYMDSSAPAKPTITAISNDTGTSGTDRITSAASQTLTGTAEANSTVKVIRGGSTVATGTANGSGGYAVPFTLVEGSNSLTVTATDIADNVSTASNAFVVTLDSTMATPTFTGISADSGSSSSDQITNVSAQTLSGTADANSTVVVKRGAATLTTVTATAGGTFTASVTLVSGVNTLTATSSDVAGNSKISADYPVTLDNTAPSAPVFTAISDDTGSSASDRVTKLADQMLLGTAEPGSSVAVTRGAATLATVTANGAGGFSAPVTLLDGINNFNARATDVAGNMSPTSTNFSVTLDTTVPATPSIAGISDDTGVSGSDLITNAADQVLSGSADANSVVTVERGGSTIATGTASGSGSFAIPFTLTEGLNTLTVVSSDLAGNVSAASSALGATLDTSIATPTLSGISNDTGSSSSDQVTNVADQTLSGTAEPGSTVVVRRGAATVATVTASGSGDFSASSRCRTG